MFRGKGLGGGWSGFLGYGICSAGHAFTYVCLGSRWFCIVLASFPHDIYVHAEYTLLMYLEWRG